jgi:hypothetical protein
MSNTITNTKLGIGDKRVVHVNIASDGSEETDYVMYDSSTYAGTDSTNCRIMKVHYHATYASVDGTQTLVLEFDASTDVRAVAIPTDKNGYGVIDFTSFGGLPNLGGTGRTGDITLTTTNMDSGDNVTIILEVEPV